MKKSYHGFTLIELLTVIAIIGILAAILIPVVGKVRENAHSAKCVGNLRSTAMAMIAHINDNDGVMATYRGGSVTYRIWTQVLAEEGYFVQRTNRIPAESIHCPSWPHRDPAHHYDGYGVNVDDPEGRSISTPEHGIQYVRNFNDSDVNASRYILFADSYRHGNGLTVFRIYRNQSNDGNIHLRHNGRANIAFLDGHVESCDPARIGTLEPRFVTAWNTSPAPIPIPQP